jgi:hypothetical protein
MRHIRTRCQGSLRSYIPASASRQNSLPPNRLVFGSVRGSLLMAIKTRSIRPLRIELRTHPALRFGTERFMQSNCGVRAETIECAFARCPNLKSGEGRREIRASQIAFGRGFETVLSCEVVRLPWFVVQRISRPSDLLERNWSLMHR